MNKNDIMTVINQANTNADIKWSILENAESKIVLTNSYDTCVKYTIEVKREVEDGLNEEWITVRDNHMQCTVAMLMKGDTRWDDYKDTKHGIILAIQHAVHNFNHLY